MLRKLLILGSALVGFTLAVGSYAWADHGRYGKRHYHGKSYNHCHRDRPVHHHGWDRNWRHHHHHGYRHHRACRYRDRFRRPAVVEKHVYHHYPRREPVEENRFKFAISVVDEILGYSFEVSGAE